MARGIRQVVALPQRLELTPPAGTFLPVLPLNTVRSIGLGRAIQAVLQAREVCLTLIKTTALQCPKVFEVALALLTAELGEGLRFQLSEGGPPLPHGRP